MALTQPILNSIAAFDATQEHIFSFISIGGDQVLGSQLTIYDNETGAQVYQGNYTSFKFEYPLAAGTLTNGKYYNATISTINNAGEFSEPSNPVAFYCYTAPVLTITNIPASGTIEQSNYTFQGNYVQAEGELLNGYQYTLYDSNKEQISQSAILYDGLYQHTFSGMANDTSYYVELSGSTINNTPVSSGLLLFTIRYIQPASFAICDLVNNCENGFIQISSNIVSIDGKSEPDPPKYIDNKEVDLTDNGSWVQWEEGFNIQNDFTMRIWGRSFGDNEPIVTMKNELDTDKVPNRIEMKFMATDIIDTLPNYIFAEGDIVTTENAVNEPITDLNIGGDSYQKVVQASSESVKFESDNGSINNANPKLGAKLDIEGNSYQETTRGYNLYNIDEALNDVLKKNGDNSYTFTKTSSRFAKAVNISIPANTDFVIDYSNVKLSGNYEGNILSAVIKYTDDTDTTSSLYSTEEDRRGLRRYSKDIKSIQLYLESSLTEGTSITFSDFMIYLGSNLSKTYEPYTGGVPSPSPDYPSEIKNVTGEINKYYILNSGKITSNGITATYTKNTSEVILDGVATRDFSDGFEIKNILLKKGTYSVSVWGLNKINEEYDRFFVADTSNNNKVIVNYVQSYRTQEFTLEQDTNIKLSFIIKAGSTYSNTKVKIMINEGDIGLSYVPYNSFKIRQTGKNILSDNRDDYNGSIYGYIKLLNNFENNNLVLSIEDNDKSIDMTGINFGVTGNGKNWDDKGIWLLYDGKKVGNSISTNKYPFFSFYPNNQTTFDKIFKRYKIQAEISKGIVPTEFEKYKSNSWIFPLEPGQKLYEGSYLAEDGIHNTRTQIKLLSSSGNFFVSALGNYQVFGKTQKGVKRKSRLLSNYFKDYGSVNAIKDTVGIANDSTADRIYVSNGISTTLDEFKDWLNKCENAGRPVILEYELAEEEIIPYTPEQQEIYSQLQNLKLYEGINNFSFESGLYPISTLTYNIVKASPAPDNPSEVHFTGDIGNQIDFPDTSVSYTDGLHVAAKPNNNYILLPNRIYTLNFDYVVTNSTTDIYYGIGYGTKDNYVGALTINGEENIQYATQNKGSNSITFQTPATFEGVDTPYLWIDFAKTIITATVAVNVSNVSLYFGEYTLYQKYGRYNVPFKILGQNLFNYQKLLYFIDNNTNHEVISNGYSVNPTVQDGDCYALIGYTNNFITGDKYTLSYQTLGNLQSFNLYSVKKGTSEIVSEIALIENVFVAPDNNYDLMLKFTIDSSDLSNNLNLWNIQIAKGEELLDYATYTENGLNMDFEQPLRSIGKIKDCILLDTVNLLNPTTLRANVKENTTYYFSSSTSDSYLLEFYNIEDNLIDTEDISSGTFTTPANCVYVTSEDFTTLNVIPEHIQIEEGNTFSQYFPYITQPSVIRNVGRIIVNGTEDWTKNETVTASNAFYLHNSLVPSYKQNASGICTHYKTISDISSAEGIFCGVYINIFTAPSYNYTVSTFKTWLAEQNSNGNPVIIYYQLSAPQVYNLSGDYATTLRNFTTQIGTNSILIDSQYPGYLRLKYVNSYTEQETKANYVLLKCWNENTIPYMIHSNYITVKSPKDKIFIWTRKKNNIFDLKIENLGEE